MSASDKVQNELAVARALVETLTGILEASGLGIVQLDAHGRIISPNEPTWRILKNGGVSSDIGGRLFVRNREDNHDFQQTLSRALPPSGTGGMAGTAILRLPDGFPSMVMRIIPVHKGEIEVLSRPVAALALIVDPLIVVEIDPSLIEAVFGLTPAEANVAALLAQGKKVRAIATSTHHSEDTILTQIKHARGKLGLTRQLELVLLVRSLGVFPQAQRDRHG